MIPKPFITAATVEGQLEQLRQYLDRLPGCIEQALRELEADIKKSEDGKG